MPSPIGHIMAGYSVYAMGRGRLTAEPRYVLTWTVFSAIAPDLDFLSGIMIGAAGRFHQGPTHSLGVALLYAVGLWLLLRYRKNPQALQLTLVFASAYASHLILDLFAMDISRPLGIPLFWPVSKTPYILP